VTAKKPSQQRQSNGCKHVGGLCLIDESKKAGKCVQTCKKCGWIRVHGERFFHPNRAEAEMHARTDTRTWRVPDGKRSFAALFWENRDDGVFVDSVSPTTGNPVFLIERVFDGAVFTPWDLFDSKVSS
jgi:hypothetical protein